ncbi:MAG: response regulator transcription factor [Actinobacteria bacterium]|nr:response regulator transcription factor [Actinomycetota bacterium]
MPKRVLIVDDEKPLLDAVSYALRQEGFEVEAVGDSKEIDRVIEDFKPDIAILDLVLPEVTGFEIVKRVREESDLPILVLSAKTEEIYKILALELGADDYITKPFSLRELISRVRAQIRRAEGKSHRPVQAIQIKDLQINKEAGQVFVKSKLINVTTTEYRILLVLVQNKGKALSRQTILNYLWNGQFIGDERILDVHIHNLRAKIETDPRHPEYILTVRKFGYRLRDCP